MEQVWCKLKCFSWQSTAAQGMMRVKLFGACRAMSQIIIPLDSLLQPLPLESLVDGKRRIFNLTNGFWMKRGWVERALRNLTIAWVEHGISCRNLELAESMERRNSSLLLSEPLPCAELPGLTYKPSKSGDTATKREDFLVWQAHDFASSRSVAAK